MAETDARFLILAPWQCVPSHSGAKLRTYYLTKALSELGRVSFLSFQQAEILPQPIPFCEYTISVPHPGGYSAADFLGGLITRTPLTVRKYTRTAMASELERILQRHPYSAVQLEASHLAAYVPLIRRLAPEAKIVLDWHNIESEIMARYAEKEASFPKHLIARATAPRFAEVEKEMARNLDAHVAVSSRDADQIRTWNSAAKVRAIDNGVDVSQFPEGPDGNPKRVLFVGAMDYHANVEGAQWFVREIWPQVLAAQPDLKLTLAGRDPAPAVRDLAAAKGVEVTGTLPTVAPYYRDAIVSVVPLLVGGGSRLKILESLAARVPVVSTSLGAEGLAVRAGEHLEIADSSAEFARAVISLCGDAARRHRLAEAGRKLVEQEYDWRILGSRLADFYQEVLATPSVSA